MVTDGETNTHQYVRISDIANEPQRVLMPIEGYEKMPLVSLEEAVAPLVSTLPKVQKYVFVAKQRPELQPADGLTQDESASITLYTMDWEPHEECLYFALNATLRTEDRRKLKPWFLFLKLILTGLSRLPSTRRFIYRGVKMDLSGLYYKDKTFVWWGFSSCTSSVEVLENEQFLGDKGPRTLFIIQCDGGKDISRHSYYQSEEEILLLPARQFKVKSYLQAAPHLYVIDLQEIEPPICFLQPVTIDLVLKEPLHNQGANLLPTQHEETEQPNPSVQHEEIEPSSPPSKPVSSIWDNTSTALQRLPWCWLILVLVSIIIAVSCYPLLPFFLKGNPASNPTPIPMPNITPSPNKDNSPKVEKTSTNTLKNCWIILSSKEKLQIDKEK